MKNKEIEELLNNIKDKYSYEPYDNTGNVYTTISYEEGQLLLSYIEQLEKRNKELYEGFMATQEELTDYATKNEQLEKLCNKYEQEHKTTFEIWKEDIEKLNQLENNRDKAIRTLETLKGSARWERHLYEVDYMLDILKGGSDDK